MSVDDIAEHIGLVVGRVPNAIVIPIDAGIIAPIITAAIFGEDVRTLTTLRRLERRLPNLFGIADEIISDKDVLLGTVAEIQADVIGSDEITFEPVLSGLLDENASI